MQAYTYDELKKMNDTVQWNHRIVLPTYYRSGQRFHLYATGRADLNGRYYVAIREDRVITSRIKEIYNLF